MQEEELKTGNKPAQEEPIDEFDDESSSPIQPVQSDNQIEPDKKKKKKRKKKKKKKDEDETDYEINLEEAMKKSKLLQVEELPELERMQYAHEEFNPFCLICNNIPPFVTHEELLYYFNTLITNLREGLNDPPPVSKVKIGFNKTFAFLHFSSKLAKQTVKHLIDLDYQNHKMNVKTSCACSPPQLLPTALPLGSHTPQRLQSYKQHARSLVPSTRTPLSCRCGRACHRGLARTDKMPRPERFLSLTFTNCRALRSFWGNLSSSSPPCS